MTFFTEVDVTDWQCLWYTADTLKRAPRKSAYTCISVQVVSEHSAGSHLHFYPDASSHCAAQSEPFAARAGELLFTKSSCSETYSPFIDRRTGNGSIKEAATLEAFGAPVHIFPLFFSFSFLLYTPYSIQLFLLCF